MRVGDPSLRERQGLPILFVAVESELAGHVEGVSLVGGALGPKQGCGHTVEMAADLPLHHLGQSGHGPLKLVLTLSPGQVRIGSGLKGQFHPG